MCHRVVLVAHAPPCRAVYPSPMLHQQHHLAATYSMILYTLGLVEAVLLILMPGLWMHDTIVLLQCDGDCLAYFIDIHNLKDVT